jgi:hypothetical protein
MDPYLESPEFWPSVHHRLITIFADQLSPLLAPKYFVDLESYVIIDQMSTKEIDVVPDVTITELDNSINDLDTAVAIAPAPLRLTIPIPMPTRLTNLRVKQSENEELVTVIELLSPVNKRAGDGRQKYLKKRNAFFDAEVHFIEIDLLRKWPRMPFLEEFIPESDYLAMVSKAYERPRCDVWPIGLRQPLPVLPVPLLLPDPDVPLDLGKALRTAYERARYDLRIDYQKPPIPPLKQADAVWAASLL